MTGKKLSVLLLCDDYRGHANTVLDHIAALKTFSGHDVRIFNPCGMTRSRYLDLNEFDVVVLHYSLVITSDHFLSPEFRELLRRFQGLKVQFIQDEYRRVDDITAMMRYLGIHVLFTLLAEPDIPKLYDESRLPGVIKLTTLAGYVPSGLDHFRPTPLASRPIDIGYRGRTVPFWLGTLGQEKAWIAQGVLARARQYNLRCDIAWAEGDRIYGQRWIEFLSSCKATLGSESGASITDFDGSLERRTKAYLAEHPTADFHEVHREILASYEGNALVTAISPRVFEAAALRTALVLFPGKYSGIIEPGIHYIPLAKDFSNLDEVAGQLRDLPFLEGMTERAYRDLVASGRYSGQAFVEEFDEVLLKCGSRSGKRAKLRYRLATLERPYAVASRNFREALRPIVRVPQDLVKASLALAVLLASKGGLQIVSSYLRSAELRRRVSFHGVLRDILKLAVLGQTLRGALTGKKPFSVAIRLDSQEGRIIFVSGSGAGSGSVVVDRVPTGHAESFWPCAASIIRQKRVRFMIWNHTAVGGTVRLALTPVGKLNVCVGDYDMHAFSCFVELSRLMPEATWDVLSSILRTDMTA